MQNTMDFRNFSKIRNAGRFGWPISFDLTLAVWPESHRGCGGKKSRSVLGVVLSTQLVAPYLRSSTTCGLNDQDRTAIEPLGSVLADIHIREKGGRFIFFPNTL